MLQLMGQPEGTTLTPEIARQICVRTGSAAVVDGSITSMGSKYVLGLRAKDCRNGEILAEEQLQSSGKEDVLNALGLIAIKLRKRVGESQSTVARFSTPLAEATTSSLDALSAYSEGSAFYRPLVQRRLCRFSSVPRKSTHNLRWRMRIWASFIQAWASQT